MQRHLILGTALAIATAGLTTLASQSRPDYPFQPVPFTQRASGRRVLGAADRDQPEGDDPGRRSSSASAPSASITSSAPPRRSAASRSKTRGRPGYPFDDTDVYKVIEGASYTLNVYPDPKLDAYVDGLIAKIAAAQEPDGYIYTTRTINPKAPHRWAGTERWQLERDDSHELYNLGHLFEAAVAHNLGTGKNSLLNVATKAADLLVKTFGPGKRSTWPGHQITEMALVRLYRVTGNEEYLKLAKFFLDERGPGPDPATPDAVPQWRTRQSARPRLQPGAAEGRESDRAGRSRRSRDVHVCGHGGRRGAHERSSTSATPATRSGRT